MESKNLSDYSEGEKNVISMSLKNYLRVKGKTFSMIFFSAN